MTDKPTSELMSLHCDPDAKRWAEEFLMGWNRIDSTKPSKGTQARGGRQSDLPTAVEKEIQEQAKWLGSQGNRAMENLVRGGQLNPTWVEWLMGYQTGWTNLNALAMRWFHSKRKKRSKN